MISIITPTYNRANLLPNMIESVQRQTYSNWELIIVDDGSTDNTEDVIQAYLTDKRIQYLKKQNSGATHTRNVGANLAKGTFLTFLDSDDEAYNGWLQTISNLIDDDTAVACCGAVRKMPDGQMLREEPWLYRFFGEELKVKFTCGSLFVKKELFDKLGGYDVQLKSNQHTDLGYRLLEYLRNSNLKKKYTNECLIQINIHGGARIRTNWKQVSEGSLQFIEKHYDFLKRNKSVKHISDIYSVIAFSNYKMKKRQKSLHFLLKSIRYNPSNYKNYLKIIKYGVL